MSTLLKVKLIKKMFMEFRQWMDVLTQDHKSLNNYIVYTHCKYLITDCIINC